MCWANKTFYKKAILSSEEKKNCAKHMLIAT